jgi:hypothetical protein
MTRFARLRQQFPDYDLATLPEIPEHWQDESWHDELCPGFRVKTLPDGFYLRANIDFADPEKREFQHSYRFRCGWLNVETNTYPEEFIETDDWNEFLAGVGKAEDEPPR